MTSRIHFALLASCTLFVASTAHAVTLTGPVYPAPGGNTYSTSGAASSGDTGGQNGNYGSFDTAYFNDLYWGPQWGTSGPAAGLDGTLHDLAFLGISGTTAIWQGTTSYTSPGGPGPASCGSCDIRLEVDISGLGANPWVLEGSVPDLSSLAPGIGAVINDAAALDFSANFQFLVDLGSGFVAINTIPNLGGQTLSTVSGAFYYTPEPSLSMLLGAACLVLVAVRRKSA